MTPEASIERCRAMIEDLSFAEVAQWKQAHPNRKVIGCFPVYTPSELIHAAGMLPVGVMGGGAQIDTDQADSRVQSFVCSISRTTLELGLAEHLKAFDGIYFPSICDVARNLSGLWRRNFPQIMVEYIHLPQNMESVHSLPYYRRELARLLQHLESLGGQSVSDDALRHSIELYNENRRLGRALYQIKRETPWLLTATEAYVLIKAGTRLPVEEHNRLLHEVIASLANRQSMRKDRLRVVLEGSFCEQPPLELIEVIEEAGCYLVDDDLLIGWRWFLEDVPVDGDPLTSLAESYLKRSVPSSVRHFGQYPRGPEFVQKCRASKVDGVIFCAAKFCEPALYDYVLLKEAVQKEGIPYLAFEFDEKMGDFERVRTQVETFVESILFFS